MNSIQQALVFTITTFFSIYIMIVLFRFLLQLFRADYRNPISQFVVKATSPVLVPLRKIIPGWGGVDFASIILLILLKTLESILLLLIVGKLQQPTAMILVSLSLQGFGELINLTINMFMFFIVILAIISWIQPQGHNPILSLFAQITDPLLRPIRRRLPPMGGLDLSPMILLFLLGLSKILIVGQIMELAYYIR